MLLTDITAVSPATAAVWFDAMNDGFEILACTDSFTFVCGRALEGTHFLDQVVDAAQFEIWDRQSIEAVAGDGVAANQPIEIRLRPHAEASVGVEAHASCTMNLLGRCRTSDGGKDRYLVRVQLTNFGAESSGTEKLWPFNNSALSRAYDQRP